MSSTPLMNPRTALSSSHRDWLGAAELQALTPGILVERARALKPLLASRARDAERIRKPVDEVWAEVRRSGVFYHFVPKRYGGLEFPVDAFVDAMLPLGEGCASTGWVTAFCVEHNWMLSQFPKEAQDEIFGAFPYIIAPGVTVPPGRATKVPGGYRLSGRWKWGTGVMHADWVLATGIAPDGATPPTVLFFALPIADAQIVDVWHVDGMAGTGSNDVVVDDAFVPEHRVLNMALMREGRAPGALLHDNPIYRMPMLPFLALTACIPAVGNARAAVTAFAGRLQQRLVYGTDAKQAEKPAAQMRLAMADIQTQTAELLVRSAAAEIVALAARDGGATVADRIRMRAKIAYAMDLCRTSVGLLLQASGAGAHFLDEPLQRAHRDATVMSSHVVYDLDSATELHGRALIGLPPNSPLV